MTLPAHVTKPACIEAIVTTRTLVAAGRKMGSAYHNNFPKIILRRFGITRRRVRDVLIIEDRRARVEACRG